MRTEDVMEVQIMNEVQKVPVENRLFTGPVARQTLAPDSKDFNISIVNFEKGVRNKWHIHASDQVLIVTSGSGVVATDAEERRVNEGDVIFVPAGERHWHGSNGESDFAHIALQLKQSETTQLED
jgi:quercetin dioxygenase-like cupin family protein